MLGVVEGGTFEFYERSTPATPNYPLRDPKYHLLEIIWPSMKVHWGGAQGYYIYHIPYTIHSIPCSYIFYTVYLGKYMFQAFGFSGAALVEHLATFGRRQQPGGEDPILGRFDRWRWKR